MHFPVPINTTRIIQLANMFPIVINYMTIHNNKYQFFFFYNLTDAVKDSLTKQGGSVHWYQYIYCYVLQPTLMNSK